MRKILDYLRRVARGVARVSYPALACLALAAASATAGTSGDFGAVSPGKWLGLILVDTDDTIASTAAETAFGSEGLFPTKALAPGRQYEALFAGVLSTTGTPTMTFRLRLDGVVGTVLLQTADITCGNDSANAAWSFRARITIAFTNDAGLIYPVVPPVPGYCGTVNLGTEGESCVSGASLKDCEPIAVFTTTGGAPNSCLTHRITLTADWSASSASNTITLQTAQLYPLN